MTAWTHQLDSKEKNGEKSTWEQHKKAHFIFG